jgi:hypothetical protein
VKAMPTGFPGVQGEKIERRTTVRAAHGIQCRGPTRTISGEESVREDGLAVDFARNAACEFCRAGGVPRHSYRDGLSVIGNWRSDWMGMAPVQEYKAHIFIRFMAEHYRPDSRPNQVYVINSKTSTGSWEPLFDKNGKPLYPLLMAELDAMKALRPTGA